MAVSLTAAQTRVCLFLPLHTDVLPSFLLADVMTFPGAAGGATSDGGFVVAAAALGLVAALLNGGFSVHDFN